MSSVDLGELKENGEKYTLRQYLTDLLAETNGRILYWTEKLENIEHSSDHTPGEISHWLTYYEGREYMLRKLLSSIPENTQDLDMAEHWP